VTLLDVTKAERAAERAAAAARAAGVTVSAVSSQKEARDTVQVLSEIWVQPDGQQPMTPELAWALAHAQNYVAIARRDGSGVAGAVAFRAMDEDGPHLHSHMAGVLPGLQGVSIGFAIKQHQRAWAMRAGYDRVTWTFDPLVSRNAFFNVMKLGANLTEFFVDFYGPLSDELNAGDESDRCMVTWRLDSPRAEAAAAGALPAVDLAAHRAAGANEVLRLGGGRPVLSERRGDVLLCQVPHNILTLRTSEPALARSWRHALREVLVGAFADGYEVTGVSRDGWYVLERGHRS
jgi:predicted GNAT superfamily acetyltransferase